jgi:2-dehydro-3-deoxyphosphogluconate aldolase/(4S)-4-hydroxy-2-oxoglutarate aldolase
MQNSSASDMLAHLIDAKVVAILRGNFTGIYADIGGALVEGGIEAIEVTFGSSDATDGITTLRQQYGDRAVIGAGTVLTPDQVDEARDAGAQYIIAPNTNPAVIERCLKLGLLAIPGAYTPTEIEFAYSLGAGMIKVFPASAGGPAFFKAIRGPFPDIPLMATGGVEIDHIGDFLKAGANAVGLGSPLIGSDTFQPDGYKRLRERAGKAMNATAHRVT